jgi:hypothetical protein
VEPHLRSLVRYQQLNLEIAALDARLSALPGELAALDRKEQDAASAIQAARHRHDESLKERRSFERDLKDLEQKIDKYNDQSREVKTNEQYRAIMSEIQTVKAHIGEVEEKILLSMEEADSLERKIGEAEKEVAARKKEIAAACKTLTDEKERVLARRADLEADRTTVASAIPHDLMEAFGRVARRRGDIVMAAVREERCTACNVRLRPALVAEVRKSEALIACESCHRLLYIFPEAPGTGSAAAGPAADSASGLMGPAGAAAEAGAAEPRPAGDAADS